MKIYIPCHNCKAAIVYATIKPPLLADVLNVYGWTNDGMYSYCPECRKLIKEMNESN